MERWREIWKYQLFEQVFSSVGKDWNQYDPSKDHTYTDIDREACQVDAKMNDPSPTVLRKKCKIWCLHFWPSLTVKYSLNIRKNMQYQFCVSKWPPFDFLPTTSSISAKTDFPLSRTFSIFKQLQLCCLCWGQHRWFWREGDSSFIQSKFEDKNNKKTQKLFVDALAEDLKKYVLLTNKSRGYCI